MRLKTILMTVLGLVAALVIAAVVFVLTLDFDQYRSVIAEKVREATGRELEIKGSLDLKLSLTPAIAIDDVRFANAPWGTRPDMVRLKSLRVEIKLLPLLTGDIEISRFVLIGPDILLETDAKGRGNWILPAMGKAPAKAEEGEFTLPTIRDFHVEDARLSYRDGVTGKTTKITLTSLTARAEGAAAPLKVEIIGAFGKTGFEISAVLGPLQALGGLAPYPVDFEARVLGAVIKAKGKVISPMMKPEIDLALTVEGKDLGGLAALAGTPLPPGPYRLKARLKGGATKFVLEDIDAGIGNSALGGKASFDLSGPRPAISADLSSSLIDLADFTPPEAAKKAGAKKAAGAENGAGKEDGKKAARKRMFSADPLPLAALGAADADIKIRIKRILAKKIALSDVAVDLTLKDGKLTVRPLKAVFAKGVITGNFELDARGKKAKVTVMLSIKKLDIAALLKEMGQEALASGQIDFYTRLRGTGNSVRAIMAGAGGRLNIVSGGARVNSKYVDLLGADLLQVATSTGNTRVNCLVARFNIANGLAKDRGILFDTERMSVRGEGTINLRTEALDLKFTPKPKDASLINLALPWRVRGTLMDPSVSPDEVSVVKEAAGLLIFGPLALLGSMATTGSGDRNPCVAALEAKPASAKTSTTQKQPATEEKKGGIEGFFEDIGKGLKGIFGGN